MKNNSKQITIGYGNPDVSSYKVILDYLSLTKVNSLKTSSIPLAQYWMDYEKRIIGLENSLNLSLDNPHIYFENATKSHDNSKSSMSDIMIISDNVNIAIEGKYTELIKYSYETIGHWKDKSKNIENSKKVIAHWKEKIKPYSNSFLDEIDVIPYQFFHRLACSCDKSPSTAVLLYQIFYDNQTESKLKDSLDLLEAAKKIIDPKNNLIIKIQTIKCKLLPQKNPNKDYFMNMKGNDIYNFEE